MTDTPAKPGSWRSFLLGVATGFGLALILIFGGLLAAAMVLRDDMVQQKAERLKAPALAAEIPADYSWTLRDETGAEVAVESFAGQPWFLHYWSPDCTACEAEIPGLNRLYESLRAEPLHFTAVVVGEEAENLPTLKAELGIAYPIYALEGNVPEVFAVKAGPATFITDRDGTIVYQHIGASKWDDPAAEFYLKSLTAE